MRIDREQVRQRMLRQGFQTFTELATHIGVSKQTMSLWFGGASFATANLALLCKTLKCTPNDILILDEFPNVMAPAQMVAS